MAIQYAKNLSVPIKDIRAFIGQNEQYTNHSDITRALNKWGVSYQSNIVNAQSIRDVIARGNIALVALNMDQVSRGADLNGSSTDPTLRIGRFETYANAHWLIVKGVSPDGRYFVVYDGNIWGGPGNSTYWYSDGTPKGLDRLYLASEVEAGMFANGGRNGSKGVEIQGGARPQVEAGEEHQATVTYYTASYEETRKRPGDPAWGIMANGNKVHWGAVAVDPEYIPLGTRMYIEGWGNQVFVAEDTGNLVKGWHVDIFWPGTRQEAFEQNDKMGGTRTIELLGPGPVFTDQAPGPQPTAGKITVPRGGETDPSRWVTLEIAPASSDQKLVGMMISNNEHFTDAFEEPFATTKQWTLTPGDGEKTVYARFKNAQGAWSEATTAETTVEEQPPVGSVIVAPDPRVALSARLSGNTMASIGEQAQTQGSPRYRPLGPNLLSNSSFEGWAGGIPDAWDTGLRENSHQAYEPVTDAHHGALALQSATSDETPGDELTQKVILKPNTSYTLSAWVRGVGGRLELEELETLGVTSRSQRTHSVVSTGAENWQQITMRFQSLPSVTDALVRLSGFDVIWDALQLEEGTAPTLYRADGVLLEGATQNLMRNSSLELGAEGWDGLNSYVEVVASPDYARFGRNALLVRKMKDGRAATFSPADLEPGKRYTYSVYARMQDGRKITSDLLRGWYYEGTQDPQEIDTSLLTDENRPDMAWEAAGGGWYRGSFTFESGQKVGLYGVISNENLAPGEVYYLDGAQVEQGRFFSSYADGSLGQGYKWVGAPFASASTRADASVSYRAGQGREGSLMFWARPEGRSPQGSVLLALGHLSIQTAGEKLVLKAGDRKLAAAPWKQGAAQAYTLTWDGQTVSFWQNGKLLGKGQAAPPAGGAVLTLGPADAGTYPNAVVGDISLWRSALAAPELAYLSANAPLDAGLQAVRNPLTQVVTTAVDSTRGEVTVEWSQDGETWYEWASGTGLHDWDLGSREGRKTVWVRYTDASGNWLAYSDTVVLDRTAPRITAVKRVGPALVLTFSEPIAREGLGSISVRSGGKVVVGSWNYAEGAQEASYVLRTPAPTEVEIRAGDGLRDMAGNALAQPYVQKVGPAR